jgi:hypothetical protein
MAAASGAQARVRISTTTPKHPTCVVHSLPSFVESGLGASASSVADVITVECHPVFAENTVTFSSDELSSRCHGTLSWMATPGNGAVGTGASYDVTLDNDGEATAVVWGGPSCAAGTSIVSAHLTVPPFATADTTYRIVAPQDTPRGVKALPSSQVEDSVNSSAATIVYAEFNPVFSERAITFRSNELSDRCAGGITWVGPDEVVLGTGPTVTTTLDNNGNAWVVALAGPSCAAGKSQIEASLASAPFTSYLTSFQILSPRVTNP